MMGISANFVKVASKRPFCRLQVYDEVVPNKIFFFFSSFFLLFSSFFILTREANRSVLFIRQRRRESAGLGLITCNIYSSAAPKLTSERSNPLGLYLLMCEVGGGGGGVCVRVCA